MGVVGGEVPGWLLVAVDDAAAGEVVRRELHDDSVLGEDPDVVLPHLAADVGKHAVAVRQLDAEHRVGQRLDDGWTVVTKDGSRAAHFEHTVAITPEGPWVLTAEDGGAAGLAPFGITPRG